MRNSEIVSYFAEKGMGSKLLNLVDLIWEALDVTEKQMAASLLKLPNPRIAIRSKLSQKDLEAEIQKTPFIILT